MSDAHQGTYYLPKPTYWPILGSIGLFSALAGAANWIHGKLFGPYLFLFGGAILIFVVFGWFSTVIHESLAGKFDKQVDRSFRWGMVWFIFSEVCFFGAFFGALFYSRMVTVPALGGAFDHTSLFTNILLWPNFKAEWPMLHSPNTASFPAIKQAMDAWGVAALNTLILLSSGATITWAHWALVKDKRKQLIIGMICTVLLGIWFLSMQTYEYHEAYTVRNLTLASGIYGTTFFMLTGFHGLHVTLGTIMLIVILIRCIKGHFTKEHQFAFEAVSWYWHFVDVVWLALFIFVYWM